MKKIWELIKNFYKEEDGATAIEYALMAALIALAIVVGAGVLGTNLNDFFNDIGTYLGSIGIPGRG